MSSIIRQRTGTVPAANTELPSWATVFPTLIEPTKLKIGDDMLGANVAVSGSAPPWNTVAGPPTWSGAAYSRTATGMQRSSQSGRNIAWIDPGLADVRLICSMTGWSVTGENP